MAKMMVFLLLLLLLLSVLVVVLINGEVLELGMKRNLDLK
jgi:hypothetical protein